MILGRCAGVVPRKAISSQAVMATIGIVTGAVPAMSISSMGTMCREPPPDAPALDTANF